MSIGLYISHPEVNIDPDIEVDKWGLSKAGQKRAEIFAESGLLPKFAPIFSSTETKALQFADIIAAKTNSKILSNSDLNENDRSSTGFLDQARFELHVTQMFKQPDASVGGWETAAHAQKRIINALGSILANHNMDNSVIFSGHGCVGTLLKCHLGDRKIARSEDQGLCAHPGGGNIFVFELASGKLLCDWTPMEHWKGINR